MFGIILNVMKYFYRNSLAYNRTAHTKNVHTSITDKRLFHSLFHLNCNFSENEDFIWMVFFGLEPRECLSLSRGILWNLAYI